MKKDTCEFGGILKYNHSYGFKIVFNNAKDAQKYKEMFKWIIEGDKIKVKTKRGYYDKKD